MRLFLKDGRLVQGRVSEAGGWVEVMEDLPTWLAAQVEDLAGRDLNVTTKTAEVIARRVLAIGGDWSSLPAFRTEWGGPSQAPALPPLFGADRTAAVEARVAFVLELPERVVADVTWGGVPDEERRRVKVLPSPAALTEEEAGNSKRQSG